MDFTFDIASHLVYFIWAIIWLLNIIELDWISDPTFYIVLNYQLLWDLSGKEIDLTGKNWVLLCSDILDNITKLVSNIKKNILCYLQCILYRKQVKNDLKTYKTNQMLMLSYILLINIQGCIYFNLLKLSLHYPTASWRCADAPETYWAALCSQQAASTCCSSNLPRICFGHNALWTFSFIWLHCENFRQLYEALFNLWP